MSAAAEISRHRESPAPTDVLFVTMAFPVASEAFAGVEVRSLLALGARVRVRALRPRLAAHERLLADWRLEGLDLTHWSSLGMLRGALAMLLRPIETLRVLASLLRYALISPRLAWRCALFVPRMFEILAECERRPPGVLHVFWGHYPAVLARLVERRLPAVHVSMSLGAYDLVYGFGPSIGAANDADTIWTHAQCNVEAIRAMGISNPRLQVLRRGLDLKEVPQAPTRKIPGRIVTVARLEKEKGVDDAIRAFGAAHAKLPHLKLVVIGEGPDRKRLERLTRDLRLSHDVQFLGAVGHSKVFEELSTADIFLLLSRSLAERLPNSVKEAMACRCVCITTRTPGIEELRAHACNPIVVEQGDYEGAGRKLLEVLADADGYREAREHARAFVLREFDAVTVAARRLSAWRGATEPFLEQEVV